MTTEVSVVLKNFVFRPEFGSKFLTNLSLNARLTTLTETASSGSALNHPSPLFNSDLTFLMLIFGFIVRPVFTIICPSVIGRNMLKPCHVVLFCFLVSTSADNGGVFAKCFLFNYYCRYYYQRLAQRCCSLTSRTFLFLNSTLKHFCT